MVRDEGTVYSNSLNGNSNLESISQKTAFPFFQSSLIRDSYLIKGN